MPAYDMPSQYPFPISRRLCGICGEKPATKHVYHPLDLLFCAMCFMFWSKDLPPGTEIIEQSIINPTWEPNN